MGLLIDDDKIGVADQYSGSYFNENDKVTMRSHERDHGRLCIEHGFLEMNKQIGELRRMVRAHTVKGTNSREENDQNVHNVGTSMRSDLVTEVSANSIPTPNSHQPR